METKASTVTIQESKCSQYGQLKFNGYYTYEHLRSNRDGGGVALSTIKEVSPTFYCDGGEDVKAITVTIHLKGREIIVTSAYEWKQPGCKEALSGS